MAAESLALVVRYVRRLADAERLVALSDGQLLEQFALQGEEAAFAVLVERHGPMVSATCRRLLRRPEDVDDVFQATFLVLARRARALDRSRPLGGWLYTVASHLAIKVRADAARRQTHERQAVPRADGDVRPEGDGQEWRAVLDEELRRLPEKYRLPLLLCYLQGKTNVQAAAELGWPTGSMSRRLARARELLRKALARRGVSLSAAVLAASLTEEARAGAPAALLERALSAALAFARDGTTTGSGRAALLAGTYLRGLLMTRVKGIAAVLLAVGVLGGGALAQRAVKDDTLREARPAAPERPAEPPVPRLRHGDVPVGCLGHPLGAALTVEGRRAEGRKVGTQTLRVETVNGNKLETPVGIWVENVRDLPGDTRIVLKGYETGEMAGPVPAAVAAARGRGEEVLLPQRGWQWTAYFIALSAAEPKLEVRAVETGFKTRKQREREEEKDR